jgi:glycosyltransferase involved in cell wall biosynthesis
LVRPHGTLDPVIYSHHRYRKRLYEQFVELRNLNGAAAVHFTSDDEAMLAEPLGLCAPSLVVPLGVDPRAYEHASDSDLIRARWPELDGQRLVLYLGRLHFKKGLRLLIQAFNDVSRHVPDARLVIAGPDRDGYKRTIARLIADLKLSDKVTFTGMLEGRFKTGMLKAASVFVLPSYGENLAFALLEAMASGTPVVATNRVNIWRDITDFAAGSVVECDPAQIAEAVRLFLRDPRAAQAAGQRGQDLVRRRYSWTTIAPRMIAAYERIVAGNLM